MASTVLTDIDFQSSVFKDIAQGAFYHRLELLNSLLMEAPDSLISSDSSGYTVSIPHFNTVTGDSDTITTSLTTTVNNLGTWKDIAAWMEREKAWGADQILRTIVPNADVTAEVARQFGEYWAGEVHKSAVSTLVGTFTTALASTHVKDDSGNEINAAGLADAKQSVLGDNSDAIDMIVLNSKVYNDAVKSNLTVTTQMRDEVYGSGVVNSVMGMKPFITDKLTATAGVYPSYLGTRGSMIYKFRKRQKAQFSNANIIDLGFIELELARVSTTAGGQDILITRASYLTHVPGVQFDGTVTSNPTNTQLATGTTWTKVADDNKYIKLIQYKSK